MNKPSNKYRIRVAAEDAKLAAKWGVKHAELPDNRRDAAP